MKRKLCPRIDETMTYVGFKLPDSLYGDVELIRHVHVQTRSEVLRTLIIEAPRARGRVASAAEMAEVVA